MHSYRLASQSTCSYISSAIDCVVSACAVNHGFWSLYIANASCEAFLRSSIAHGLLWALCAERDFRKFYANRNKLVLRSVLTCCVRADFSALAESYYFEKGLVRSVPRLTKCFTFANAVRGGMLHEQSDAISRRLLLMPNDRIKTFANRSCALLLQSKHCG